MSGMTLGEAWLIFGEDAREILLELRKHPRCDRVSLSKQMLEGAKKKARKLMAKHHPDRGGDSGTFINIQKAILALESHTNEFEVRMIEAIKKAEEKAANRPIFIKIDR